MSRDDGSWRQQQQQQQGIQEPGITACVSHYTPVMSRSIYTRPLSTARATLCYPVSALPLWALRPSPAFKYPTEIRFTYTWTPTFSLHRAQYTALFTISWCLDFPLSIDFARPGIRPGSDTEALAISCSSSVFGEMHFLEPGVGSRALQHSGILAGREEVRWCFELFPHTLPSLAAHRSRHPAVNSHLLILIHQETDVKAITN